ncbi:hypothetical protein [Ideonella sp. A 288]|uniref:hypothetical protein n=1 Tax=Ideonella sp. A 288 TaxID=1962181 RepID=UPI001186B1FC|nr:hypothetical protein [Ideonella sp. A 288]
MTSKFSSLALAATTAAIALTLGLQARAHTTAQVQASEGTTTYNNLVIGHGCTLANGTKLPVIAQSVVFPTVNPKFTTTGTFAGNPAVVSITSVANLAQLIQSKDIFSKQKEKTNAAGNVIGFESTEGSLEPSLHGLVPFRTAGVSFPADSCATKLVVQVAVADICQKLGAKNLWIPSVTTKYSDPAVDGIGSPASLTFNRDLAKNPLPAACGAGYFVTVTPSAEDVDANLKIDGYLN